MDTNRSNALYKCVVKSTKDDNKYGGMYLCIADSLEAADVKVRNYIKSLGFEKTVDSISIERVGIFSEYSSTAITNNMTTEHVVSLIMQ